MTDENVQNDETVSAPEVPVAEEDTSTETNDVATAV